MTGLWGNSVVGETILARSALNNKLAQLSSADFDVDPASSKKRSGDLLSTP